MIKINGVILFTQAQSETSEELWKTDGTPAGTVRLKDLHPESSHRFFWSGVRINQYVYFTIDHGWPGAQTAELWRTDGTQAGTVMVKQFGTFKHMSNVYQLAEVNGMLLLVVGDREHGIELWRSDGTAAGTALLKDIKPGPDSSHVRLSLKANGRVLLMADDGVHGYELWQTDGTTAGTRLVQDFIPGGEPGSPQPFGIVGGRVYLVANDGVHGRELWALPTSALGPQFSTYVPLAGK